MNISWCQVSLSNDYSVKCEKNAKLRTEEAFFCFFLMWEVDVSSGFLFGWGGRSGLRVENRDDQRRDPELRMGLPGMQMGDLTSRA